MAASSRVLRHRSPCARSGLRRAGLLPLLVDETYGQVWVLDSAGHIDGYAVVTWSWSLESGERDSILDEMYVENGSASGGSRLLRAALAGAREAGAQAVFLKTEGHNGGVRSFY